MTRKTPLRQLGLEEPLDRQKVLGYLWCYNKKIRWQDDSLVLVPKEDSTTKRKFQQVLDIRTAEDVAIVRQELKARRR